MDTEIDKQFVGLINLIGKKKCETKSEITGRYYGNLLTEVEKAYAFYHTFLFKRERDVFPEQETIEKQFYAELERKDKKAREA